MTPTFSHTLSQPASSWEVAVWSMNVFIRLEGAGSHTAMTLVVRSSVVSLEVSGLRN